MEIPLWWYVPIVQIPIYKEFDSAFESQLIGANCPEHLGLLASVEAVDVNEGVLAAAEAGAEGGLVGKSPFLGG